MAGIRCIEIAVKTVAAGIVTILTTVGAVAVTAAVSTATTTATAVDTTGLVGSIRVVGLAAVADDVAAAVVIEATVSTAGSVGGLAVAPDTAGPVYCGVNTAAGAAGPVGGVAAAEPAATAITETTDVETVTTINATITTDAADLVVGPGVVSIVVMSRWRRKWVTPLWSRGRPPRGTPAIQRRHARLPRGPRVSLRVVSPSPRRWPRRHAV